MSNPSGDNSNFRDLEEEINIDDLKKYCDELKDEFQSPNFYERKLTKGQKAILSTFPESLKKLSQEIEEIQKEENEFKVEETDPKKRLIQEQKKQKNQERLKVIGAEIFIASCASSTKSIDESLKFHAKNNLGIKELNDFNKNDINALTAILASGKSLEELKKFLKTNGVDVNHKSVKSGNTAFHKAAEMGIENESIKTLIDNGANINLKNNFGLTALDIAISRGDEKMSKFLIEKGGKAKKFTNTKSETAEQNQGRSREINDKKPNLDKNNDVKIQQEQKELIAKEEAQIRQIVAQIEAQIALALHEESKQNIIKAVKEKADLEAKTLEQKKNLEAQLQKDLEEWQKSLEKLEASKIDEVEFDKYKIELKKLGINVDNKEDINKLLHDSAKHGMGFMSNLLVRLGGDVNYVKDGITVLEAAVLSGNNLLVSSMTIHANPQTIKNVVDKFLEGDSRISCLTTKESEKRKPENIKLESKNNSDTTSQKRKFEERNEDNGSPYTVINPSKSQKLALAENDNFLDKNK